MFKNLLVLLSLIGSVAQAAPQLPASARPASLPTIELLTNGSFEALKAGWSASTPSTFTIDSATPLNGGASGVFTATAGGQSLSTAQNIIKEGLKGSNCSATFLYKTAETTNFYSAEVVDGSANVISGPIQLASPITNTQKASLSFQCPTSGTLALKFLSSGSAAALKIDDATLGKNDTIQVSQASLYGSAQWPDVASCSWTAAAVAALPGWTDYTATAACTLPAGSNLTGAASAPATKIPAITFAALEPGEYEVEATGSFLQVNGTSACQWRFFDGTTGSQGQTMGHNNNTLTSFMGSVKGRFNYDQTQTNITFKLQTAASGAGAPECDIENDLLDTDFTIKVHHYPSGAQKVVRSETNDWIASGIITGANPDLTTSTYTTFQGIYNGSLTLTADSYSIPLQIPCSATNPSTGSTCAAGNEGVGIVFTAPAAQKVEACIMFTDFSQLDVSTNQALNFKLVETANNSQTITQSGSHVNGTFESTGSSAAGPYVAHSRTICDQFVFASGGKKTLRLYNTQNFTAGAGFDTRLAADGLQGRNIKIYVRPITQTNPTPTYVGSVITNSPGIEKIERAQILCSGASAVNTASSPWISAIGNIDGSGNCALTLNPVFSGAPACTMSIEDTSTNYFQHFVTTSSTALVAGCADSTSTACTTGTFNLICVGPK